MKQNKMSDKSFNLLWLFRRTIDHNDLEGMRSLLDVEGFNFKIITNRIEDMLNNRKYRTISGDMMTLLLADDRVVFGFEMESRLICKAAELCEDAVLKALLQSGRGDPGFNRNEALTIACRSTGSPGAVHLLLSDERVNFLPDIRGFPTIRGANHCIKYCARSGDVYAMKMLMQKDGFYPAVAEKATTICVEYSNLLNSSMLEFLLQEGSCDPSALNNNALQVCCANQQLECVRLLLADPRVDLTVNYNMLLRKSIALHRQGMVNMLISHRRSRVYVLASHSEHPYHLANVAFVRETLMDAYRWTKRFLHKYPEQPVDVIVMLVSSQLSLEQRERGMGLFKGGLSREEINELVFRRISALVKKTENHAGQYTLTL
jgi:hypothetical protein